VCSKGGEDIDFVFQFKEWYGKSTGLRTVVSVPGANASHPWWNNGDSCYGQINGWAWGDSRCIEKWPEKTYLCFPNWIECIVFGCIPMGIYSKNATATMAAILGVTVLRHLTLALRYSSKAFEVTKQKLARSVLVAIGAGTIVTSQELVRVLKPQGFRDPTVSIRQQTTG
jgi:hypothetical protein